MSQPLPSEAVFVTVGNATQGFARLLAEVERLADAGALGSAPFVQVGSNPRLVSPRCTSIPFLGAAAFAAHIAHAEVVICHAGAGTLLHVLAAGRVPVVVPRRRKYDEVVDDHQVELTEALAAAGRVIPVYDTSELGAAVPAARARGRLAPATAASRLLGLVATALDEIAATEARRAVRTR